MAKLKIAEKGVSLVHGDISISFEKHHGYWTARLHISDDVFCEYIKTKRNINRSVYNFNRDGPENCNQQPNYQSPPGEMSWPGTDRRKTHSNQSKEE